MKRYFFPALFLVLFTCFGCSPKVVSWNYNSGLGANERAVATKITEEFSKTCAQTRRNPDWIESASISYSPQAMPYRQELYGWKGEFVLTIKVSSKASIPAAGHILEFFIGGGKTPGVLTQKTEGQDFYGMPISEDGDGFDPNESYTVVAGF